MEISRCVRGKSLSDMGGGMERSCRRLVQTGEQDPWVIRLFRLNSAEVWTRWRLRLLPAGCEADSLGYWQKSPEGRIRQI